MRIIEWAALRLNKSLGEEPNILAIGMGKLGDRDAIYVYCKSVKEAAHQVPKKYYGIPVLKKRVAMIMPALT